MHLFFEFFVPFAGDQGRFHTVTFRLDFIANIAHITYHVVYQTALIIIYVMNCADKLLLNMLCNNFD
ncbi:hypothetical protein B2J95_23755 [Enterobacter cloacae]|nr:hypothetical protein B2J95_23755 [Enterobacter cloacae]EBW8988602.1 hypothetical protein [Salmonella enterica subsp. enterica serovar Enteritidis]OXU39196.1 hypothetical protein BME83_08715 [Enterobacter cloacae subsp. cloacae]PPV37626.1 hypothetical protein C4L14_10890 [Enterobacter sp. RC4]KAA3571614.1 hypothetical protein D1176_19480 [Enterobacter cloacae]